MNTMNTQFQQEVFVVIDSEIKTMTFGDYLLGYIADETTSPVGVQMTLQIRHVEGEPYENEETGEWETTDERFEVFEWVHRQHKRELDSFETKEEAQNYILELLDERFRNANFDHPPMFESMEEAMEFVADNA